MRPILSILMFFVFLISAEAKPVRWKFRPASPIKNAPYSSKLGKPSKSFRILATPETLRVLGICVEFQKDEDEETTGDGKFLLESLTEPTIDPPPHDIKYFEDQLLAMANYYQHVSHGKLTLLFHVWPELITLSHEMGYYNPASSDEATEKGLVQFALDAIQKADSLGVPFSSYDTFILFHAGVGNDLALDYDSTPKDLPSVFLNLYDFEQYGRNEIIPGKGIPVQNGNFFVNHAIVLPETESQEGYELGLLGTSVLMMGFRLGLPALWNTETGASGIGRWGLMDQGSSNFNGLIPAEPCAFEKYFLGYEIPKKVYSGNALPVGCSKTLGPSPRLYQVSINDHEFFLVENRMHDPNGDGITRGWDREGREVRFLPNGQIESNGPFGVIVRIEEYDFALPGSGILIWHVDENVLREGLSQNRVNVDPKHRGVDLEEADGAQDIGESYGFLSGGAGSELGVMHDAWYQSNEIHKLANQSNEVRFDPHTHPNTNSYSGGNTHFVFFNFSDPDTVMTFSLRNEWLHPSFPIQLSQQEKFFPPLFGDLNGDGIQEICFASKEGNLFGCTEKGNPLVSVIDGDTGSAFVLKRIGGPLSTFPVLGDMDGNQTEDIFWATENGEIQALTLSDVHLDGPGLDLLFRISIAPDFATALLFSQEHPMLFVGTAQGNLFTILPLPGGQVLWKIQLGNERITGIAQWSLHNADTLLVTTEKGKIHLLYCKEDLVPLWTYSIDQSFETPPCTGHFLLENSMESVQIFQNGFLFSNVEGKTESISPVLFPNQISSPALADFNRDSQLDIVLTGQGKIWAFSRNGTLLDHFPVTLRDTLVVLSSPVVADVDGNGQLDIVVSTSIGTIEAFGSNGKLVPGFPLPYEETSSPVPVTLTDIDADGFLELLALSSQSLSVWDLPGPCTFESLPWGYVRNEPSGKAQSRFQPTFVPFPSTGKFISWAYNYPNPAYEDFTVIRYRLEAPAKVEIFIYDLSGEKIAQFSGPGEAWQEHEIRWNLEKVESGVYFCEIKAKGQGKTETAHIKMAVVK